MPVIYHPLVRICSRIGCTGIATSTAVPRYEARMVELVDLRRDLGPGSVDLCPDHAGRLTAPRGWALSDVRVPSAVPA